MSTSSPAASSSSGSGLLKSSISSASSLMALQLLSRGFTFALNQALFRLASPSAFGAAAIQFELLLSTILFLSREGVRNALLRTAPRPSADSTLRRMNLAFLPLVAGIPLALTTAVLYTTYAGREIRQQPHFEATIALYAVSAVVELLSEPFYNVAMVELQMGVRVRAEGLGITAKSITTFLVLFYDAARGHGALALLAFAYGQLVYALVMLAVYTFYLGKDRLSPKRPASSSSSGTSLLNYIDHETLHLSFTMTLQSLVKHFLTEGDKMVLSWFSPLQDQGGYAIAVNYGSLIARIIFQPIEESLRVFFSKTLGAAGAVESTNETNEKNPTRNSNSSERRASLIQSADTLRALLSIQVSMSSILVVFGSAYMPILLPLLLPSQYLSTSAPSVLAAWIWYIPVLAVNGGLEAFLSSVATPKDLNGQSRWMIFFSIIYIISAILLYRSGLGDSSLVYANIINLSARIIYALHFTTRFFAKSSTATGSRTQQIFIWKDALLPSRQLCVALGLSSVLIYLSDRRLKASAVVAARPGKLAILNPSVLIHVAIGSSVGLFCLFAWWRSSGRHLNISFARKKAA